MRTLLLVTVTAALAGCAASRDVVYRPTARAAARDAPGDLDGHAAAVYRIPAAHPRGELTLATMRVGRLHLPGGRPTVTAVQVRMLVHNADGEIWTIDTTGQTGVVDGGLREEPVYATCDGQAIPLAVLMPGETRTIDLYYELPSGRVEDGAAASVRVDWRVRTTARLLAHDATAFERHVVPAPPPPAQETRTIARELEQVTTDDGMPEPLGRELAPGWGPPTEAR